MLKIGLIDEGGRLLGEGLSFIGKIFQAIKQSKRGEELSGPHIRGAENKPVTPTSKQKFSDELKTKLEKDGIHQVILFSCFLKLPND